MGITALLVRGKSLTLCYSITCKCQSLGLVLGELWGLTCLLTHPCRARVQVLPVSRTGVGRAGYFGQAGGPRGVSALL